MSFACQMCQHHTVVRLLRLERCQVWSRAVIARLRFALGWWQYKLPRYQNCHLLLCLRMPFDTTATLFLLALSAGKLAASLSRALLYLSGSITTPGVFRILGLVRFL